MLRHSIANMKVYCEECTKKYERVYNVALVFIDK